MTKVAFKNPNDPNNNKNLAKIVFKHWKKAIDANGTNIDRTELINDLLGILDVNEEAGTGRKTQLDVVFDSNLDAQTRLVWLAIPTPDPKMGENWKEFKKRYYDDLVVQGTEGPLEEALGTSLLFGCGK
jgi:hypothetical protein